jgi:hypothetical protein
MLQQNFRFLIHFQAFYRDLTLTSTSISIYSPPLYIKGSTDLPTPLTDPRWLSIQNAVFDRATGDDRGT